MAKQPSVLIVDDEEDVHTSVTGQLRPVVGEYISMTNGQDAWDFLRSGDGGDIELIVCDMTKPAIGGIELLQRVRASGLETPFVFVTQNEKAKMITQLGLRACFVVDKTETGQRLTEIVKKTLTVKKNTARKTVG